MNVSRKSLAAVVLAFVFVSVGPASAQSNPSWDASNNSILNGAFYFREVVWVSGAASGDTSGSVSRGMSIYGTLIFDGHGNYTLGNAQICDTGQASSGYGYGYGGGGGSTTFCNSPATVQTYQKVSGTYAIAANGYGFISGLVNTGDSIYGSVTPQGVFIGSSPDNASQYNDLFIAAPVPTQGSGQPVTNSFFNGTYTFVDVDFAGSGPNYSGSGMGMLYTRSSSFPLTANGSGSISSLKITGQIAGNNINGPQTVTQTFGTLPYSFSNSAAVISFGGQLSPQSNNALIGGTKYLYFSPDGNFVFGGGIASWDMIVGVRTGASPPPAWSGLYYQAGVDQDDSGLSTKSFNFTVAVNSRFGSVIALPGALLGHRRIYSAANANVYDYTSEDGYTVSNGTFQDPYDQYTFSSDGRYAVGIGTGNLLGINVLTQAPAFPSTGGVFVSPVGILNAGSSAPFTAGWAPGELVSIYGSNLTSTTVINPSLPTTLGGVQVMVNSTPAPIYGVAHTANYDQINAVIPLATSGATASLQVINNGAPSNVITNFLNKTQPGVFNSYTTTPAVQHNADFSLVTPSSPAQVGETLAVYLTGLGTVDSSGNASGITAYIDGIQATVTFAGTTSPVGGGYQVNITVPSGVSNGSDYLDISGPDAYDSSALIQVGTPATGQTTTTTAHRVPKAARFIKSLRHLGL